MYDIAYLSTAYLPPVSYFCKLYHYNQIGIEIYSNYTKQTYRNRCNIIGANGIMPLSIPIIKPLQSKCPDKDLSLIHIGMPLSRLMALHHFSSIIRTIYSHFIKGIWKDVFYLTSTVNS